MKKTLVSLIALALAVMVRWVVGADEGSSSPPPQGTHIVVRSAAGSGPDTLRDALARATPGTTVTFDPAVFPADNPTTILIEPDPLPTITQGGLVIDGRDAGVILDGSALPGLGDCLVIRSSGNVIRGLQILRCPAAGVRIVDGGSNNLIGGINATPGGACSGDCNVISGPGYDGVNIAGSGTMSNVVSGNYIGIDGSGTRAMGSGVDGVWIGEGARNNVIGGDTPGERNVISGNANNGIVLDNVAGNVVSGNYIGTDAGGTTAMGNGASGVGIAWGAQGNLIGGDKPGAGNVISGNGEDGIGVGGKCTRNTISGNYIGTDATGTVAVPNRKAGVNLSEEAHHNLVGGSTGTGRNLISGNGGAGLVLAGINVTENLVSWNTIGTDVTGTAPLGNAGPGISVGHGATSNTVGPGNVVAFNEEDGIRVQGPNALGNTLTRNSVYQNGDLGISLENDGNGELEQPVISTLTRRQVKGTALPGSVVEIFFDESDQGRRFAAATRADGEAEFSFTTPRGTLEGPRVTCTATDPEGNTSSFSEPRSLPEPTPFRAPPYLVGPSQISLEPEVVGTNAGLALFCVLFFGLTSTVFNSVLEEYNVEIERVWGRLVPSGLRTVGERLQGSLRGLSKGRGSLVMAWLTLMLLTAVVESFLDPDVGIFSPARLSLILTLFVAALIVGGLEVASDVLVRSQLNPETRAQARLNVVGLVIAGACVLLSRGLNFKPGYLYGTVGALYLIPELIGPVKTGKRALAVLGAVFAGGLLLWGVSGLLPPGLAALEALFLTIFLIAVQGVFFELLPLAVTEGGRLFRWKRWVWLICLGVVLFVVAGSVLNPHASAVEALRQNGVIILLILLTVYGLATLAVYLLFPVRLGRARKIRLSEGTEKGDAAPEDAHPPSCAP